MTLFFLEAFEQVHKSRVKEYEEKSREIDKTVEETEPGMLIHVLTKVSEEKDVVVYRWMEVYNSLDDLMIHVENPPVQAHIQEKIETGILSAPIKVTIYCDWTDEQKEPFLQNPEANLSFAPLVSGYFR